MREEHRWLILRLEAPLLAFGGVAIDQVGVTRDFPAASMLTGLIANALGWERTDWEAHQGLQDRLVFAVRLDRENQQGPLIDTQNARLYANEEVWTSLGSPEGRNKQSPSFSSIDENVKKLGKYLTHRRQRYYHADACVTVALRFLSTEAQPDLDAVAQALQSPARPLFLGRKPCLPSAPLYFGEVTAATAYQALQLVPLVDDARQPMRALWPPSEGPQIGAEVHRIVALPDLRNWKTGLHGGSRSVVEGQVSVTEAGR